MIFYDSHRWISLCKLRGSIFPKAILYSLPSVVAAYTLKALEHDGRIDLSDYKVLANSSVFSGFTIVLAFTLVFRTNQGYARYWAAALSAHELGSEWTDACTSIFAFVQITKKSKAEVNVFAHTMIRLFSLLHAMAMEEIASLEDENFPLIDIEGFEPEDLAVLIHSQNRVQTVFCWIKLYIIQCVDSSLLNAPAPIITRVFQELGSGLVRFHNAQQVMAWPFPFPYTQMNMTLIQVYLFLTPIVICTWGDTPPWLCAALTLASDVSIMGLELIAAELEQPFGDDPNDLPVFQLQHIVNKNLFMLLNKNSWRVPRLHPMATLKDHEELEKHHNLKPLSLQSMIMAASIAPTKDRGLIQRQGSKSLGLMSADRSIEDAARFCRWLKLPEDMEGNDSMNSEQSTSPVEEQQGSIGPPSGNDATDKPEPAPPISPSVHAIEPFLVEFLEGLSRTLQTHLKQQLHQLEELVSQARAVPPSDSRPHTLGSPARSNGVAVRDIGNGVELGHCLNTGSLWKRPQ